MTGHETFRAASAVAAMLTPPGRGAVATIRLRGEPRFVHPVLENLFRPANGKMPGEPPGLSRRDRGGNPPGSPTGRLVFGRWGAEVSEEVVVCRIDEATFEIHCHGGRAAPEKILSELEQAGVTRISAEQMLQSDCGILAAEFTTALSRTRTVRTAGLVLSQAAGVFEQSLRQLREAAETQDRSGTVAKSREAIRDELQAVLSRAEFGRHLTRPWRVAITGRPNVGKSSLVNALVGYSRAIVFEEPGTTRDLVTAETAFDGWPVELIDTAGIRRTEELLEAEGIRRARDLLASSHCSVLLLDCSRPISADDRELLQQTGGSAVLVAHKSDLPPVWNAAELAESLDLRFSSDNRRRAEFLPVSSVTGDGLEELQREIVARLVPDVPPVDAPIPVSDRQIEQLGAALEAAEESDFSRVVVHLTTLLGE